MPRSGDPGATPEAPAASAPMEGGCLWCGAPPAGAGAEPRAGSFGVRRCARCGAASTEPRPTDAELEAAYARYRPDSGRFLWAGDALLRRTRAQLAARIDELAPPGRVLDVGAGDGVLLDALHSLGRDALGLERDSRRHDVREAEVTELDGEWAAVVFWHTLEHLPAPGTAIDHAARLLAPGGALFVAVPNTDSLQARCFGERWFHLDLPRHLVHLPARALTARLRALGLSVTRVSHWRGGQLLFGWLHGLVGSLPGGLDVYDAIRRPEARSRPLTPARRALTLAAGVALFPVAAVATVVEVALRHGGTFYVEARRA
jgi:SAM-dependent methyltransferase